MRMSTEVVIAIVGSVGTIVVAIIALIPQLKKIKLDQVKIADEQAAQMRDFKDDVRKSVSHLQNSIAAMKEDQNHFQETIAVKMDYMARDFEALSKHVERHNNFAERMPAVEEQIKATNNRINDLERRVNT